MLKTEFKKTYIYNYNHMFTSGVFENIFLNSL